MQSETDTKTLLDHIMEVTLIDASLYLLVVLLVIVVLCGIAYSAGARSRKNPRKSLLLELVSDDKEVLSCGRVISLVGLAVGSTVLLAQAFGQSCGQDFQWALAILFGGAYGTKTISKKFEKDVT